MSFSPLFLCSAGWDIGDQGALGLPMQFGTGKGHVEQPAAAMALRAARSES